MPANWAPIAFFAFNRPVHTARALAALALNAEAADTVLYVFIDGPRCTADEPLIAEVIGIAEKASGFRNVQLITSISNRGLYQAITSGVSHVLSEAERVIVVEDDIVVSQQFLKYINVALQTYANDLRVGSIHAYTPPACDLPEFFFLRGADCWGWATWKDRWILFNRDARDLLCRLVRSGELSNFSRVHGVHTLRHLIRRSMNRNQSWAAHWNASLFLEHRLTLHPGRSFVQNIGNDGTGTHSKVSSRYLTSVIDSFESIPKMQVKHDGIAALAIRRFYDIGSSSKMFSRGASSIYLALLRLQARALALLFTLIIEKNRKDDKQAGRRRND